MTLADVCKFQRLLTFALIFTHAQAIGPQVDFEEVLIRAAEIYKTIPPDVAVTLPQLTDRSRDMLTRSDAVRGHKQLQSGQMEGGSLPGLFPRDPSSSPSHDGANNLTGKTLAGHLRGMMTYAMTGSVTAVGVTIGSLVAQSLVEAFYTAAF